MIKDDEIRIWVIKKLITEVKTKHKETADMTATGLIDWALRKIAQENT